MLARRFCSLCSKEPLLIRPLKGKRKAHFYLFDCLSCKNFVIKSVGGESCASYQWLSVIGAIRNNLNFSHAICFQACHASGKSQGNFFKVREFCKLSGIFKILAKNHGIVREFCKGMISVSTMPLHVK